MTCPPRKRFYFEDYTPGLELSGGEYRVTEEEIIEFGQRFDPQPFHTDPVAAKASHFGGLVAPGALTFAIRGALINQFDFQPVLIAGLGVENLVLTNPVRAGDQLTLRLRVVERRRSKSRPSQGIVAIQYDVENQDGRVALSMTGKMLVALRDPESADPGESERSEDA